MDNHLDTFDEVQKAVKVGGLAALVEERRGSKNPHPKRVPEAVEQQILELSLKQPNLWQPAGRQ